MTESELEGKLEKLFLLALPQILSIYDNHPSLALSILDVGGEVFPKYFDKEMLKALKETNTKESRQRFDDISKMFKSKMAL